MSFLKDIEDALRLVTRKPLLCVFCVNREIVGQHGLWHFLQVQILSSESIT